MNDVQCYTSARLIPHEFQNSIPNVAKILKLIDPELPPVVAYVTGVATSRLFEMTS